MQVTYLQHSGFMVESSTAIYLFDYIGGDLKSAEESEKKIYVFVSHAHADHFDKSIFGIADKHKEIVYILSYDVMKKIKHNRKMKEIAERLEIVNAGFDETIVVGHLKISTLKSTDEGVAFIVKEPEGVIYHAGDLNWWHWQEESKAWNRNMEVNFKREIDKMKDMHIDIAFVPLDPRQEDAYYLGMKYFIEHVNADKIYPMHFWGQPEIIEKYKREYGGENIQDSLN